MRNDWAAVIRQLAPRYNIDPNAALAISSMEGLSGNVGDHGTSFGPFQLHVGGALPQGRGRAWAESTDGIAYALAQMAKDGAAGKTGRAAIEAISRNFERPADPASEIAGALAHYGKVGGGGGTAGAGRLPGGLGTPAAPSAGGAGGVGGKAQLLKALMANNTAYINGGSPDLSKAMQALQAGLGAISSVSPGRGAPGRALMTPAASAPSGGLQFSGDLRGVKQALVSHISQAARAAGATQIRVISGYRSPEHNASVGGVSHSNHMTGDAIDGEAYVPGKGWVPLGALLRATAPRFGLRSGDVPGFYNGAPDPNHVDDGANQR